MTLPAPEEIVPLVIELAPPRPRAAQGRGAGSSGRAEPNPALPGGGGADPFPAPVFRLKPWVPASSRA